MELTMTNNFGFTELNEQEMIMIDGGSISSCIIIGACTIAAGAVGLAVAGPLGAAATAKIGGVAGSVVSAGINIVVPVVIGYFGNQVADSIINM